MKHLVTALVLLAGATLPQAAFAQEDGMLDEIRAGVFFHSAYDGFLPTGDNWDLSRLEDVKVSALFNLPAHPVVEFIGSPRLEVGGTLNFAGWENLIHANLNWQFGLFDTPLYIELGFGGALTDAALDGAPSPGRDMGCPLNFYDTAGIGAHVTENVTVTLRYEHISNLDLCENNDGLSNLGLMVGFTF
ncbi:acyloxyacyl hydrolase [Pelagibacterium xiamenense]|uniref:acyloxyacyl hydrolase n=1 Tax=Pelagibacterium xiamenense TaxID=2901140 RepID=UPI001E30C93B|nr:acyloxyacyl hydrolase [Pelagibacterium xiamenense]MCD7058293.1 acyloxyacyl hydrolase [Pelagibacterium xiamenense]